MTQYPPYAPPPPEPPRRRRGWFRSGMLAVLVVGVAIVAAVIVRAVDSGDGSSSADSSSTGDPAAAQPAAAETNEHGNVPAALGEPATITDRNGTPMAIVTVTAVTPDHPQCQSPFGALPNRGHSLLIELHIETTEHVQGTWLFNLLYLSVIGPDGNTETAQPAMLDCGGQGPPNLGPSQAANAQIVLDSSYTSGALVYRPVFSGNAGWEWPF